MIRALLIVVHCFFASSALAVIETYEFSSTNLEERYQKLSAELRCPKCQNQNIADSNAPIAQDLRMLLHRQLEAGASDAEIKQFMVARYGEFVLYRPRFSGITALLWLAPLLLFLCAGIILFFSLRRPGRLESGSESESETLSDADQRRLSDLLDPDEKTL